jgi:peptidoglycan hydrolase CwlO-like protein
VQEHLRETQARCEAEQRRLASVEGALQERQQALVREAAELQAFSARITAAEDEAEVERNRLQVLQAQLAERAAVLTKAEAGASEV